MVVWSAGRIPQRGHFCGVPPCSGSGRNDHKFWRIPTSSLALLDSIVTCGKFRGLLYKEITRDMMFYPFSFHVKFGLHVVQLESRNDPGTFSGFFLY